jgi:hypothetical protein
MKGVRAKDFKLTDADLSALASQYEPIILLTDDAREVAAVISIQQLRLLQAAEEHLLHELDLKEVKKILTNPKWIPWEEIDKQLKH